MQRITITGITTLLLVGALSQSAAADDGGTINFTGSGDGTINFTGEIVAAACSISPNSQNLNIPLGKVTNRTFGAVSGDNAAGKGKLSTPAKFTIDLLGCDASKSKVSVAFKGVTDPDSTDDLRVGVGEVEGAGASGVAVRLMDSKGIPIKVNTAASGKYGITPGDNSLKFQAAFVATGKPIVLGVANTTVQFQVNYE